MKLLERIALTLAATEKEKERIAQEMDSHIKKLLVRKSSLLVVSSFIEEVAAEPDYPFEELSLEDKKELIIMLNKRLSQVNNTQEKAATIAQIVSQHAMQRVPPNKVNSFFQVLVGRLAEQIKVQVSANKSSALGYGRFMLCLSKVYPQLLPFYRKTLFKSILPLEYLLGMYRVYFTLLKETGNTAEAWEFIASLINCTEDVNSTFNPRVVSVFLDELRDAMDAAFRQDWRGLASCIRGEYLPLLSDRFATDISAIGTLLSMY